MIIEITLGILLFLVGYILGRLNLLQKKYQPKVENNAIHTKNNSKRKRNKTFEEDIDTPEPELPKITIDESKFVTTIKTDSFQKDFEVLGEKSVSDDNINSSVSKLSQLKRNKE